MSMREGDKRVAIVLTGGGMRSAHGAGFLYCMGAKLGLTTPDIIIGSSGNAGNVLYFAAGQYEYLKIAWTKLLSTPKFISLRRLRHIMDIDYLIDTVFRKQVPLDVEELKVTPVRYFLPVTNATTGATRYFTNADDIDPFELLRAAKALPIFFGKKVPLLAETYIDGEVGPTLHDHIACATAHGATDILLINDGSAKTPLGTLVMELYARMSPPGLKEAILRDLSEKAVCVTSPHASILCVRPERLPAHVATRSESRLCATFEAGIADAFAIEGELRALFVR